MSSKGGACMEFLYSEGNGGFRSFVDKYMAKSGIRDRSEVFKHALVREAYEYYISEGDDSPKKWDSGQKSVSMVGINCS